MEEEIDYNTYALGYLQEVIESIEAKEPFDKRTKEYKIWKDDLNSIFEIYNEKAKSKVYIKIK